MSFFMVLFLPFTLYAQTVRTIKGDCTPQLSSNDGATEPLGGRRLRRLPYINTKWDSTRVYRQAVILVSFSDVDFKSATPRETFDSIFNVEGYNVRLGPGCVAEYFRKQSEGWFNLQFDVYGPIKVGKKAQPYSNPTEDTRNYGKDVFVEATKIVRDELKVDFTPYDWDGDGEVEQIIYVYAGLTGNQSASVCYGHIWPNTGSFEEIVAGDVTISEYTASAELWYNSSSCGIGTICHEFSHSLGLPDIYPTVDGAGYSVVDEWDLMDGGNFTNYGSCPPNYTPLEKMLLGWLKPVELTEPTRVRGLKTVDEGGVVYKVSHTKNEYYLIENRQQKGWDLGLPGRGLLVYHVNYSNSAWNTNRVNVSNNRRFELIPADGMDYDDWDKLIEQGHKNYANKGLMNSYILSGSPYPWTNSDSTKVNNELSNDSNPPSLMQTTNDDSHYLSKSITNITMHGDGTVSFNFMGEDFLKGDVNGDGGVDVADISAIITYMTIGDNKNVRLMDADVNGDGEVDVADISATITVMINEGKADE